VCSRLKANEHARLSFVYFVLETKKRRMSMLGFHLSTFFKVYFLFVYFLFKKNFSLSQGRCFCGVSVVCLWCVCGVSVMRLWCVCGVSVVCL